MARSSVKDPVEKFRFVVTFLDDSGSLIGESISSNLNFSEQKSNRAGFKDATLPKANVTEIIHRENVDGNRPIKVAGLASYEPITLHRGVTKDRQLYNWYRLVNDDAATINRFTEALSGLGSPPFQEPRYRKEVLLSSVDRSGNFIKHWLLINAWPIGYKGGDDFDASADAILIEELTITYESFLEVTGNTIQAALRSAEAQAEESTRRQAAAGIISTLLGT